MLKKAIGLMSLTGLVFACTACERISFSYYDRGPSRHHVTRVAHVCTHGCHHHYYNGSRLVVLRSGHRHGPGCGHHWSGTYWVVRRGSPVRYAHTPNPVVVRKSRAHPRKAVVVRKARPSKTVVIGKAPGRHYVYDRRGTKWVKIHKGHVHGPSCGHIHVEGRWSIRIH